jgi:amino acid transporter
VSGWLALTTSGGLLASQLISGLILLFHPDFVLQPYQVWLIYVAWTIIAFCINAFLNRLLPYVNRGAFIWSIGGFAIVCITVLACASPNYASAEFVFTEFINETGWPDGVSWLLGLLQGGFGITGYDAVAHMIEEIPNASVEGPKIMIYCVMIGTVTGFLFLMVLLFVSGGDAKSIIESASGPLLQILFNATKSRAGAVCLLMFPLGCILFAEVAISKSCYTHRIRYIANCVFCSDHILAHDICLCQRWWTSLVEVLRKSPSKARSASKRTYVGCRPYHSFWTDLDWLEQRLQRVDFCFCGSSGCELRDTHRHQRLSR